MGRAPCCAKVGLHRGPWTAREDALLTSYIHTHGEGNWRSLPKKAGLLRCGKSCRLRWMNYLRPDIKRGNIGPEEEDLIVRLHCLLGNRWSLIAGRLPGRTDNEIKNYWNSHLSKKLRKQGFVLKQGASARSKRPRGAPNTRNTAAAAAKNSTSQGGNGEGKIYAPKPTRFASRAAAPAAESGEESSGGGYQKGSSDSGSSYGIDDVELCWPSDAGFLDANHLDMACHDFPLHDAERLFDEYSQLLQFQEMDKNPIAEPIII